MLHKIANQIKSPTTIKARVHLDLSCTYVILDCYLGSMCDTISYLITDGNRVLSAMAEKRPGEEIDQISPITDGKGRAPKKRTRFLYSEVDMMFILNQIIRKPHFYSIDLTRHSS